MADKEYISDELLAAYLEGNTTQAETLKVLGALKHDKKLRETLEIVMSIDDDELMAVQTLPAMKLAAGNAENVCSVMCEAYILRKRGIDFKEQDLLDLARKNQWLKEKGTPLHFIGQLLGHYDQMITRRYNAGVEDIKHALSLDNDVIAVVDSDKLYPGREDLEDEPNHAVVVLGIDDKGVRLFDSMADESIVTVDQDDFILAWNESHNYMVRVLQTYADYDPQPVDLGDIQLTDDLLELREAIAENAHDVWAVARMKEGWTYGKVRDDANKKHPDLIPYSALPDSEKEYDRLMALDTIKLVKKLGFTISKD